MLTFLKQELAEEEVCVFLWLLCRPHLGAELTVEVAADLLLFPGNYAVGGQKNGTPAVDTHTRVRRQSHT